LRPLLSKKKYLHHKKQAKTASRAASQHADFAKSLRQGKYPDEKAARGFDRSAELARKEYKQYTKLRQKNRPVLKVMGSVLKREVGLNAGAAKRAVKKISRKL